MRIIMALIFTFSVACQASIARYEYYSDLPFWESPLQLFKGQNPVSKSQASKLVHVQVGYDALNRIVDIQTRHQGQFKPFYRGFGSLYLYAVHTKISYQKDRVILSFFNTKGNQIKVNGDVWQMQYSMDSLGRFKKLEFMDDQGKAIENRFGYANYQWHHQDDGSVIETRYNLKGELKSHRPGFEFERIRMVFDSNGHLTLMQNIDDKGMLVASKSGAAQYRYFYNSIGGFDRWEVYDEHGKPAKGPTGTAGEQYTFNDKGWTKIAFFNPQGQPDYHASGAVNWHASYDKFGNMIARWFTDENEKNISGRYGFHKVKYVYDSKGLYLLSQEYYSPENRLVNNSDGVANIVFKYDEVGNLLEQKHLNVNGDLVVDEWRKYALVRYEYNNDGVEVAVRKFDANGVELSN